MPVKMKLLILLIILVIEYNLQFPDHLNESSIRENRMPEWSEFNGDFKSKKINEIMFSYSGEVEKSKIPYLLMAITFPYGLCLILKRKYNNGYE